VTGILLCLELQGWGGSVNNLYIAQPVQVRTVSGCRADSQGSRGAEMWEQEGGADTRGGERQRAEKGVQECN